MREEGGRAKDGQALGYGLDSCASGAFCSTGKRNIAWETLGTGDSRFCFGHVEFEMSRGHPETEVLNE